MKECSWEKDWMLVNRCLKSWRRREAKRIWEGRARDHRWGRRCKDAQEQSIGEWTPTKRRWNKAPWHIGISDKDRQEEKQRNETIARKKKEDKEGSSDRDRLRQRVEKLVRATGSLVAIKHHRRGHCFYTSTGKLLANGEQWGRDTNEWASTSEGHIRTTNIWSIDRRPFLLRWSHAVYSTRRWHTIAIDTWTNNQQL